MREFYNLGIVILFLLGIAPSLKLLKGDDHSEFVGDSGLCDEEEVEVLHYETVINRIYEALVWIESTNTPDAIGDNGKAYGILQIRENYWKDAVYQEPSLKDGVDDWWREAVLDPDYSKRVLKAYMDLRVKVCVKTPTEYDLVRMHNGGPNGHLMSSTLKYLEKYKFIRGVLDLGFEPIKGTPVFRATRENSNAGIELGYVVEKKFFNRLIAK